MSNSKNVLSPSPGLYGWAMLFCAIPLLTSAQNLLPNGGFELPQHDPGNRWYQPVGQYMHYERNSAFAANGHYYNGICMYSSRPNEYFRVPLMAQLDSGSTYRLSMKVLVWKDKHANYQQLDSLGVLFTTKRVDVSVPFYCFEQPTLKIPLQVPAPQVWVEVSTEYQADGTERYLLLGNFFEKPVDELEPLVQDMGSSSSKARKQRKDHEAFRQAVGRQIRGANPAADSSNYFHTRWYFDDVCLALLRPDGYSSCHLEERPREGEVFVVRNIHFDTDRSELLPASYPELDRWVERLQQYPALRLRIDGHTDNAGSEAHNQTLSEARAAAVASYLVQQGIATERLESKGFGNALPIADNASEAGRAANRRVEFLVLE